MTVQWKNPSILVAKTSANIEAKVYLTPSELVSIIYVQKDEDIVEIIGEILANCDIKVAQKVKQLIEEW